jgi:hypothetical protein
MRPRPHHLRVLTRRIAAVPVAGDHRDVQVLDQWIEETALEFLIGYRVRTDYVKVRATRIIFSGSAPGHRDRHPQDGAVAATRRGSIAPALHGGAR